MAETAMGCSPNLENVSEINIKTKTKTVTAMCAKQNEGIDEP